MPSRQMIGKYDPVRKERFVQNLILRMRPNKAAEAAGFHGNMPRTVAVLMKDPEVLEMLEDHQQAMRERYTFDADRARQMLIDAFELARRTDDPKGMVAAVRELNEMHGLHAKRQVEVDVQMSTRSRRVLAELSDDELMKLEGMVLDAEFQEVEDDQAAA